MRRLTQKELVLTALTGLLSIAFYGGFVEMLKKPAQTWLWYAVALLGIASIGLLMITVALIQHRALRWLAGFLPALATAGFGWSQPSALAGAGLLAIATLIASVVVRDQLDDYVRFRTRQIFWGATKVVIIGTVAALAGLYFPVLVMQLQGGSLQVSEHSVEPLVRPLTPIVQSLLPGYRPEQPLSQLVDNTVLQQLPLSVQKQLAQQLKTPRPEPVTITTVVTQWLNQHLNRFAQESPMVVSLLILIPTFFTIWFLSPVLLWPSLLLIAGLLWVFKRLHLVRIESRPEPVEHLTLT